MRAVELPMAGGSTAVLPVPGGRRPEQDVSLPTQVYFEVTNRCNLACTTCVRTFNEVEPPADLSYEELVGIAEQLPRIERAVLHGIGEPLLVKDLPRMVAYLKSRGAHVLFNTNATALTRGWGERLIEAGLDECRISLDAASHETFLAIRGTHDFERVLANAAGMARLLRERGATHPRLSIWATAMRENVAELPALARICNELDIPVLYLQRLVHFDTGLATREQSLRHDIAEAELTALAECERVAAELGVELRGSGASSGTAAVSERSHADRPWSACYRPWKVAYVTANGNAMPCCFAPFVTQDFPGLVLGNVLDDGFAAVWNGARYQEFRRRHQSDDPPPPCKPCGSEWSL